MTWSARRRSDCGIVSPSAFAVLRLMTSSNLRRLLDGQVGGLGALEDLVHEDRRASPDRNGAGPVRHEAPGLDILPEPMDRRQPVLCLELREPCSVHQK